MVDAAIAAGAGHLVYASVLRGGSTQLAIAAEHKATEQAMTQSNVPFTVLRNSFCTENYTAQISSYLARGATVGAAGGALISAASRADCAAACITAPTQDSYRNALSELGGPPFTMHDIAGAVSRATGTRPARRPGALVAASVALLGCLRGSRNMRDAGSPHQARSSGRWTARPGRLRGQRRLLRRCRGADVYTLRGGIAEKITCPVFVGRGESDEFFLGQPEKLMQHRTAPATLGSFTNAEGAGAHCQAGAFRLLCARMLDWLDETLPGSETS